ncbi:MAG: CHASE2 domain-containing protein [Candidatus Omnitrophica bacterium]|nr:CHASE2 domain-containing protein [Candidatus Omnitrophota bacterium]
MPENKPSLQRQLLGFFFRVLTPFKKWLDVPAFTRPNIFLAVNFLGIILLFAYAAAFRVFENNELDTLDWRFRLRPLISTTDKIVIIEIADDTIAKLGRFPFDRKYHALLINVLSQSGAKAVLFDIFFSEPSPSDGDLAEAIKNAGNVYLPYVFDLETAAKQKIPLARGYVARSVDALTQNAKGVGHINIIPDTDGKYRRVPLLVSYNGQSHPYLSLRLAADFLGVSPADIKIEPGRYVQVGNQTRVPLDANSNAIINYAGPWGKYYRHYSFVDVLRSYVSVKAGEKPFLDLKIFKDKICLVGLTATGTADLHPNAFASLYPALGTHADLVNSILKQHYIVRATSKFNAVLVFILGLLIAWGALLGKPLKGFIFFAAAAAAYIVLAILLFIMFGLWVDLFVPLYALLAIYFISTLIVSISAWKKSLIIDNELKIAKNIQESFLPKSIPAAAGLDVAAVMHTARQVGGDLYDFYEFTPGLTGIMIGDVSGKGMPASLFMTTVSGSFKFFAKPDAKPEETLHNLNVKLQKESATKLFVTIFYAIFDMDQQVMAYSNGGHLPVLYLAKNTVVNFLDVEEGFPLGVVEGSYGSGQTTFVFGDIFVFYTDGITEAKHPRLGMYGKERLVAVVKKNRSASAQVILSAIEKDVRQFEPKHKQSDDITLIVVKIK